MTQVTQAQILPILAVTPLRARVDLSSASSSDEENSLPNLSSRALTSL